MMNTELTEREYLAAGRQTHTIGGAVRQKPNLEASDAEMAPRTHAIVEHDEVQKELATHEISKEKLRKEVARLRAPIRATRSWDNEREPSTSSHFLREAPHTALALPQEKNLRTSHDSVQSCCSTRHFQSSKAGVGHASLSSHRSPWSFASTPHAIEKNVPWEQTLRSPIGNGLARSVSRQGKDRARSHSSPDSLRPPDVFHRIARSLSPRPCKRLEAKRPDAEARREHYVAQGSAEKNVEQPPRLRDTSENLRLSDSQVMQRQWGKHQRSLTRLQAQEQAQRAIIASLEVEEKRLRAEIDSLTSIHAASVGDVTEALRIQMSEVEHRQRATHTRGAGKQQGTQETELELRAEIALLKADNALLATSTTGGKEDTEARVLAISRATSTLGSDHTVAVRTASRVTRGHSSGSVHRYEVMVEKQNRALRKQISALTGHFNHLSIAFDTHVCEEDRKAASEAHGADDNRWAVLQRVNAQLKSVKESLVRALCVQAAGATARDAAIAEEAWREEVEAIRAVLQDNDQLMCDVQELLTKVQMQEKVVDAHRALEATRQCSAGSCGSESAGCALLDNYRQLHALQKENEALKAENERLGRRTTHKDKTGAAVPPETKKEDDVLMRQQPARVKKDEAKLARTRSAVDTAIEMHLAERAILDDMLGQKNRHIDELTRDITALQEENQQLKKSGSADAHERVQTEQQENLERIRVLLRENARLKAEKEDLAHSHRVMRYAMEEHRVHDVAERVKQKELVEAERTRATQLTKAIAALQEEYDTLLKKQEQDVTRDEECIAALRDANALLTTELCTQRHEERPAMEDVRREYVIDEANVGKTDKWADVAPCEKEELVGVLASDKEHRKEERTTSSACETSSRDSHWVDGVEWWKTPHDKGCQGALEEDNGREAHVGRRESEGLSGQRGAHDDERIAKQRASLDLLRIAMRDEEATNAARRASSESLETTARVSGNRVQELRAFALTAQHDGEREKEKYDALQKCEEEKLVTLRQKVVALEQDLEVSRSAHRCALVELEETEQVHHETITRLKQQQMALIQDQSFLRTTVAQLRKEEHRCEAHVNSMRHTQQCDAQEIAAAQNAAADRAAKLDAMKREENCVRDELTTRRAGVDQCTQKHHTHTVTGVLLASESTALAREHASLRDVAARARVVELPSVRGKMHAIHDELATQHIALLRVTGEEPSPVESLQQLRANVDALEQHETALLDEEMKQEEHWRANVLMDLKREELRLCKSVEKLKQEEVRLSTPWASLDTDHTPGVNVATLPISEESSQLAHHDVEVEEDEWRQRALQAADENVRLSTDVAELREQYEKKRNEVNAQAEHIESMRLHREHLEREIHLLEQRLAERGHPSGAPGILRLPGRCRATCATSSTHSDDRAVDSGSGGKDGDSRGSRNVEELEKKLRAAENEVQFEREERMQTDRFYEHLNEKMLKLSGLISVNEQLLHKRQSVAAGNSKRTQDDIASINKYAK